MSCTISRNGDLIHRVFFQVSLPALSASGGHVAWVEKLGHNLVNNVNLEIGGQEIDKHYNDWLEIWSQLTVPAGQKTGYAEMIGDTADLNGSGLTHTPAKTLYIPLNQLWGKQLHAVTKMSHGQTHKQAASRQQSFMETENLIVCKIPSRWNTPQQRTLYQTLSETAEWPACKLGMVIINAAGAISVPVASQRYGKLEATASQTATVLVDDDRLTLSSRSKVQSNFMLTHIEQ